jgi:hypothetical protein
LRRRGRLRGRLPRRRGGTLRLTLLWLLRCCPVGRLTGGRPLGVLEPFDLHAEGFEEDVEVAAEPGTRRRRHLLLGADQREDLLGRVEQLPRRLLLRDGGSLSTFGLREP